MNRSRTTGAVTPGPSPSTEKPHIDLDGSIVAQIIEVGLLVRYRNDIEGAAAARRKIRDELLAKGWVLPPHTYEDDM